jgi:putative inorganic carbon (hco3(-)) transporter
MTSLPTPLQVADSESEPNVSERAVARPGSRREWVRRVAVGLMALALACSPAYVLRPHVGPVPTTVLELLLLVAIPVGLYAYWGELPWANPYLLPGLLLLAAATLDTIFTPDRRAAIGLWKAYFVEPMLAGLVVAAMARNRSRARVLLLGLAAGGSVSAVLNILAAVTALLDHTFNLAHPAVAIYPYANALPLFLEPLLAFALALAFFSEDRRERILAAAFAALAAAAIGLSFSRAGWLALIALVLLVALFTRWRWWLVAISGLLAAVLVAVSRRVRERILVELNPTSPDNTLLTRLSLWKSTLNMLQHQPLFGSGLAGFQTSILRYKDPNYHEDLVYPHNLLLNFWSETGLLGLAAFLWLAVQALRTARRGLAAGGWPRAMAIGAFGMILTMFVHGLVDAPYFKNDLAVTFWALLGLQLGSLPARSSR